MPLSREERDGLLRRMRELEVKLFPESEADELSGHAAARLQDTYYQVLGEYGDRLPRVVLGICPFTNEPLLGSFDPFALDGPWWWKDLPFEINEPAPPPTLRVLLGALALNGREPAEVGDEVIPGPEVPFVVPRLLDLPGMAAVISRLDLSTGDVAYPITYWSRVDIAAEDLHQPWLRPELWFDAGEGAQSWLIANDPWDFDLAPWIASDKLFWIEPGGGAVLGRASGKTCPYLHLSGDRLPQSLAGGERVLLDPPDGTPINPFLED